MKAPALCATLFLLSIAAHSQSTQTKIEQVNFYSEAVQCGARLYLPAGHTPASKLAAVVVAPGERATRASIENVAENIARHGIVAMAIDYRGFGGCGGFLYFGEPVRFDDRMRFSQMTAAMRIRRGRLDPQAQIIDIRNAMTFLQGVPGVDRGRIGVFGTDLAGGHAIAVAGSDARAKAVVAQTPIIAGKDVPRAAFKPTSEQQAVLIRLARRGAPPTNERVARSMNDEEADAARAEYQPYWYVDQIPQSTAVLFVVAADDEKVNNDLNAIAASKLVKGQTAVTTIAGAKHSLAGKEMEAANAAAEWFAKYL